MTTKLCAAFMPTPIGSLLAVANSQALILLQFVPEHCPSEVLHYYSQLLCQPIALAPSSILDLVRQELADYFQGTLKTFTTPVALHGTAFQQEVWRALPKIPYGRSTSYESIAQAIGKPSACRAVGNANNANKLAIIIPCHRVIAKGGLIGGYNGGNEKKRWLLEHEKNRAANCLLAAKTF